MALLEGGAGALAVASGSAAVTYAILNIARAGDEIIASNNLYGGTYNLLTNTLKDFGIITRFFDPNKPEDIKDLITEKTRAIVVVHLWGLPSKMTEIKKIAEKHDLKIIEDASHAHGASWRGKPCGSLGDVSVFSLQGDKLAPGGEGGIFLCSEQEYYEKAVCLVDITRIIEL